MRFIEIMQAPAIECPITKKIRLVKDCEGCDFYYGHSESEVKCKKL